MQLKTRFISSVFLMGTMLALSACVEVRDHKEGSDPAAHSNSDHQAVVGPRTPQNLTVEPLDKPNSYRVRLAIPAGTVSIQKKIMPNLEGSAQTQNLQTISIDSNLKFFADSEVQAGKKYQYFFGKPMDGEIQYSNSVETQIPVDFVFPADFSFPIDSIPFVLEGFERVFIPHQSRLTTMGQSVVIKTRTLIVDDGVIQTFPPGQTAGSNQMNGRHGGKVSITTDKAIGHLRLELRGENGAAGTAGQAYASPAAQGYGSSGPFLAGGGTCTSFPGSVGESGTKGRSGGAGGNGGASGSAILNISDISQFQLDPIIEPGLAGTMGTGGPGQPGGAPGVDCYGRVNGSKGTDGPTGDNGLPGRAGETLSLCLNSKNQNSICY